MHLRASGPRRTLTELFPTRGGNTSPATGAFASGARSAGATASLPAPLLATVSAGGLSGIELVEVGALGGDFRSRTQTVWIKIQRVELQHWRVIRSHCNIGSFCRAGAAFAGAVSAPATFGGSTTFALSTLVSTGREMGGAG